MNAIKLFNYSPKFLFVTSLLLITQLISFACASSKIDKISEAYVKAQSSYKKGEYSNSIGSLENVIEGENTNVDYDTIVPRKDLKKILPILNDYAFFIFKYYEQQAARWCSEPDQTTSTDFLTFRLNSLDHAKNILLFVIKKDPNRTVAYLNLADVLYNNDEKDSAEKNYELYAGQMKKQGKENKIPERAINPEKRNMLINCSK